MMKLMIASDIHGSAYYCEKMLSLYEKEKAEKLILLGDLLYHGPRNDLPKGYDPKKVIDLLNEKQNEILCVRGNCEAEVDQMVLEFPVMADYMVMWLEGKMIFVTHGHLYNTENPPKLKKGDVLLHGHTHVHVCEAFGDGFTYLNPGSVSIPKGDEIASYMIYEDGVFTVKDLEEKTLFTYAL